MDKLVKYSFPNMVAALAKSKMDKVEGFNSSSEERTVLGLSFGLFITLLILSAALWLTALILLIKHINSMPAWAIVLAILCLFLFAGGPIIAILLTTVRKNEFY